MCHVYATTCVKHTLNNYRIGPLTFVSFSFVGKIDLEELINSFKELGLDVSREEATKLLQR